MILGAPWIGNYTWADNIIIRVALLLWIAYSIRLGALEGLFAFLASFSIFIERNHQVMTSFPVQFPKWPKNAGQEGPAFTAAPLTPSHEQHHYEPPHAEEHSSVVERHGETTTEQAFESAADIQDSNPRVGEIDNGSAAGRFFEEKGLV